MIGIIGVGSFGTSLAYVLANNNSNEKIYVWDVNNKTLEAISKEHVNSLYLPNVKLPDNIIPIKTLTELLEKVKDIIIAIPSNFFTQVLSDIKPLLHDHRIAWATKGLEHKSGKLLHEIIIETLGSKQIYGVLSGPSFATEIVKQVPTAICAASNNQNFTDDLIKYFNCKNFKVYPSTDIIGLQLGGLIKNVIALACGISDGLGFGSNTKAVIITKGLNELRNLGKAIGAHDETFLGISGLGDLILTATDDQSRNRRMGIAIGEGKEIKEASQEIGQAIESLSNCTNICNLGKKYNVELTIANAIKKILKDKHATKDTIINLI